MSLHVGANKKKSIKCYFLTQNLVGLFNSAQCAAVYHRLRFILLFKRQRSQLCQEGDEKEESARIQTLSYRNQSSFVLGNESDVCRLRRHVGWRHPTPPPPAVTSRASLKLQIAAADAQMLTRARVSLLRCPEMQCCAHRTFLSEPCRARDTLASFRATWLLNKVFPSVAISQRHLAPNPAGQRCT